MRLRRREGLASVLKQTHAGNNEYVRKVALGAGVRSCAVHRQRGVPMRSVSSLLPRAQCPCSVWFRSSRLTFWNSQSLLSSGHTCRVLSHRLMQWKWNASDGRRGKGNNTAHERGRPEEGRNKWKRNQFETPRPSSDGTTLAPLSTRLFGHNSTPVNVH